MRIWLCEKPDQAKNLAPLLGSPKPGSGFIETNDGRVTWGIGHLLQQAQPDQYTDAWGQWNFGVLPMIPQQWRLLPSADKKRQLDAVVECLKAATEVVIATDCGQEGECIARELLDHAKYRGRVRRLWYSSLDEGSLRKAIASLRDGKTTEPMYWAAQARARADWLIGMNLSRAYTLRARANGAKEVRTIGRVQTPTLALVVRRDREIESFVPRSYYSLEAQATTATGQTVLLRYAPSEDARIFERNQAEALAQQLAGAAGPLQVEQAERTQGPPKLLSLTGLARATSRKFGWKTDYNLEVAQSLYDKKLTTYPRTSSTLLPNEQEGEIPAVLDAINTVPGLSRHVGALSLRAPVVRKTVFNTAKMEKEKHEHHAIIPTTVSPAAVELTADERAAYMLIAQHYVAALLPDYRFAETRMALDAAGVTLAVVGRVPIEQGWRMVFGAEDPDATEDGQEGEATAALPAIAHGTGVTLAQPAIKAQKTTPPKRYTTSDLETDMESVAKFATDPAIKARLKETSGIGTVATRAAIVKGLRQRGYLADEGKFVVSTPLGRELVDMLPLNLTDPATTAVWEERLDQLRQGSLPESARDEFVAKVAGNVSKIVAHVRGEASALAANRAPSEAQLKHAKSISETLGIPLTAADMRSFSALAAYIDAHAAKIGDLPPSAAQLAFAEKVATEKGIHMPDVARQRRKACADWLDTHAPRTKTKPAAAKKGAATTGARRGARTR